MRTQTVLVAWIALLLWGSAGAQVNPQKLQEAARLPQVSITWGFGITTGHGLYYLVSMADAYDSLAEIAAIKKQMRGEASDAERYARLGQLYGGDIFHFQAAEKEAAALYSQRVKQHPNEGPLLVRYAEALSQLPDRRQEAESALRHALQVAPQNGNAWAALGNLLSDPFWLLGDLHDLGPEAQTLWYMDDWEKLFPLEAQHHYTPEAIARAQSRLEEANRCFEKAVALAPQQPEIYLARSVFRNSKEAQCEMVIKTARGQSVTEEASNLRTAALLDPQFIADLNHVADLDHRNVTAIGIAVYYSLLMDIYHNTNAFDLSDLFRGKSWATISETTRRQVDDRMRQLKQLVESKDRQIAVRAAELLGTLQLMANQSSDAEKTLRGAMSLAPSRFLALDLLAYHLKDQDRPNELVALCQEQLQRADTSHTRYILAATYAHLRQLDKANAQVLIMLKTMPDDATLNLAHAVLLIKRNGDPQALSQAGAILAKLQSRVAKNDPNMQNRLADFQATHGIYLALTGHTQEAADELKRALQTDPYNDSAKDALQALNGAGS